MEVSEKTARLRLGYSGQQKGRMEEIWTDLSKKEDVNQKSASRIAHSAFSDAGWYLLYPRRPKECRVGVIMQERRTHGAGS